MSEAANNGMNPLDPFGFWKTARDANMEAWSKMMIDIVNSDEYARTTGAALDQYLTASQPFRDALERSMTQTLAMMNMPSRAEVISLAERLVNVEMRLDDMDAKLSEVHRSLLQAIKEAAREAASTTSSPLTSRLKNLDSRVDQVNAKLDALLIVISSLQAGQPQAEKPAPNSRPAQAAPAAKKPEEGKR